MSAMTDVAPTVSTSESLRSVLFGPDERDLHEPWRKLLSTAPFRRRVGMSAQEHLRWVYERVRLLNAAIEDPLALVREPARLAGLHEWLTFVDPTLAAVTTIHYNLFLGSLQAHSSQRPLDLDPFISMRQLGTFLLTEVGHGNDAGALETTAVYDRATDTFTLRTPNAGAQKFLPNTSPIGGPKTGLVGARLLVEGRDEGVFLFLVPLTDGRGVLPGIRVRRLPARLGSPHDHCLTSFDRVRLPRAAMLGGVHGRITDGGAFTSDVPERHHRFMTSIDRIMTGRICLSAGTVGASRAGLTAAVRYGRNRQITGVTESSRLAVFALRSHHGPLVEAIATVYAMNMLYREATRRWSERDRTDQAALGQAARFVSVAKAWITWQGRSVGAQVRERCGAQGLLVNNGIVEQLMAVEGAITAEGDNQAIMVQAATELLLLHRTLPAPAGSGQGRALNDPGFVDELLAAAEGIWLERARLARRAAPAEALARRNHAMGPALRAVDVHGHRQAARVLAGALTGMPACTARELLGDVHLLFALRGVAAHSGDLLRHGFLNAEHVDALPLVMERLVACLAGHAEVLVDAFAVPEAYFEGMPIASGDYLAAYDDPGGPWHRGDPVAG
ncbi:acyl-CoA dehydrogenase family protein [Streptomyces sp. NBC_01296]|uniref:acyl-CoA dehydrogenase family protein n=1 Tax=Streptomyces sp. NBC_01296 TaxID=2903816 RepID=UPI002E12FA71|nr:acyl-CoA dehydrogenase [Streptomyces sp. NBC_01296]